jgi:hypothetical protein
VSKKRGAKRSKTQARSKAGERVSPGQHQKVAGRAWLVPLLAAVGVGALIAAAVVLLIKRDQPSTHASAGSGSSRPPSAVASTPTPAAARSATGQTIDGIRCDQSEQVLFHIHSHLAIFNNGQPRPVPAAIGIQNPQVEHSRDGPFVVSGSCFYWLHSHTGDGVIHVESPIQRIFTLEDYFDLWGQPLKADQVGTERGQVTAYLNGQRFTVTRRSIPLTAHAVIQLDVGTDTTPAPYTFAEPLEALSEPTLTL